MVQAAEIQVSASGHACERNAVVAASEMYSAYRKAMRSNFSAHRSAMPIYYFDGTGQSLGKGLCHAGSCLVQHHVDEGFQCHVHGLKRIGDRIRSLLGLSKRQRTLKKNLSR